MWFCGDLYVLSSLVCNVRPHPLCLFIFIVYFHIYVCVFHQSSRETLNHYIFVYNYFTSLQIHLYYLQSSLQLLSYLFCFSFSFLPSSCYPFFYLFLLFFCYVELTVTFSGKKKVYLLDTMLVILFFSIRNHRYIKDVFIRLFSYHLVKLFSVIN